MIRRSVEPTLGCSAGSSFLFKGPASLFIGLDGTVLIHEFAWYTAADTSITRATTPNSPRATFLGLFIRSTPMLSISEREAEQVAHASAALNRGSPSRAIPPASSPQRADFRQHVTEMGVAGLGFLENRTGQSPIKR